MNHSPASYTLRIRTTEEAAPDVFEFDADTLFHALKRARESVIDRDAELWRGDEKLYDLRLLQGGVWQFFPVDTADEANGDGARGL